MFVQDNVANPLSANMHACMNARICICMYGVRVCLFVCVYVYFSQISEQTESLLGVIFGEQILAETFNLRFVQNYSERLPVLRQKTYSLGLQKTKSLLQCLRL